MKYKIQVPKEHYGWRYESIDRWSSYYYQIENILKNTNSKNNKILEIGVGNHFIQDKLKRMGYNIFSVDFDKELKPDYVGDITYLPFKDNSFDIVCAFEVLEHLPFKEFKKALLELKRVSKKVVLISIPYSCFSPFIEFKFIPFTKPLFFELKFPLFFLKHQFKGEHYWEMGKKKYNYNKIKKEIKKSKLKIKYIWKPKKIKQIGFCLKK